MTQVFISYRRDDQAFAEAIREHISGWGYETWMDKYNIKAGANWPDAIQGGLESSHIVVGILSPEAVESRNVKNEWDWALVNRKPLILLMHRPADVPMNYISINYINFSEGVTPAALEKLRIGLDNAFTATGEFRSDRQPHKLPVPPQREFKPTPETATAVSIETKTQTAFQFDNRMLIAAGVAALLVIAVIAFSLLSGSDEASAQAAENGESLLASLARGEDINAVDSLVCDINANWVQNLWASDLYNSIRGQECVPDGENITCSYELFTNNRWQPDSVTFRVEDDLLCDIP